MERAIAIRERLPARTRFYFRDQLGQCQTFLAHMLCLLGFPDQALRLCERASSQPRSSLADVDDWLLTLAMVYMLIRDWRQVLELSDKSSRAQAGSANLCCWLRPGCFAVGR